MIDYKELRTVKQLAAEAPFVTESKLRWWIFHAETNGIAPALIKIGGRVYIDRAEFNKWLEGQRRAPKSQSQAA
ncbi:DNA-binding protein [Amorphus sp. 3PC139-8]|uniref:DNA-binding protein n=1 Tax=Amorphus sp. 3PC139-8 TaxID=2735676 RepID=UPI00345CD909